MVQLSFSDCDAIGPGFEHFCLRQQGFSLRQELKVPQPLISWTEMEKRRKRWNLTWNQSLRESCSSVEETSFSFFPAGFVEAAEHRSESFEEDKRKHLQPSRTSDCWCFNFFLSGQMSDTVLQRSQVSTRRRTICPPAVLRRRELNGWPEEKNSLFGSGRVFRASWRSFFLVISVYTELVSWVCIKVWIAFGTGIEPRDLSCSAFLYAVHRAVHHSILLKTTRREFMHKPSISLHISKTHNFTETPKTKHFPSWSFEKGKTNSLSSGSRDAKEFQALYIFLAMSLDIRKSPLCPLKFAQWLSTPQRHVSSNQSANRA